MLTPTHVQVAVLRTKDLIFKGKNGTNDAYIIYSLGKEKFSSSVKEKASQSNLEWNEGCDISIPTSNGNKSELVLKVMHKASIGDKFLGRISLPLSEFDVTGKAKAIWYPLKPKVGSEKDTKYRGEIEVRISFLIKSAPANVSTNDLSKTKRSGSFKSSLGSILSLGKSKKKKKEKADSKSKDSLAGGSSDSLRNGSNSNLSSSRLNLINNLPVINDDPGVISEEEEEAPLQFKIDRKSSIQSTTTIDSGSLPGSIPSTPKAEPKPRLQEIFIDSPPVTPRRKVEEPKSPKYNDYDDDLDNSRNLSPGPKPRTVRLPSVIVEEPVGLSSSAVSNNDNDDNDPPRQVVPGAFATLPRQTSPSKLSVSASMSNLLDPSNNGKGSVRKTIKSMFSASTSKHLSVDQIFPPNKTVDGGVTAGASSKQSGETSQQRQFPGAFLMKKRDSLRDLGIPKETYKLYERKSKEEMVAVIVSLQNTVNGQKQKIGDLEDYIDKLLLRVLDNAPGLLKSGSSIRRPE